MYQDLLIIKTKLLSSRKTGFTLVEILISMLFFSIIAISLSLPLSKSTELTNNDQNIINANNLAKSYLKNIEINWSKQIDFDEAVLPEVTAEYDNNGAYKVSVLKTDLDKDAGNITILKRVNVKYKDSNDKNLVDFYMDYTRP